MALNKIKTSSLDDDSVTSAKLANGAVTANDINDGELPLAKISQVNLDIAPEVLEIQVSAPQAGQDTQWLWTWLTSSLPYARREVTNSPEIQVPLYRQGTYTVNNYAAYDLFDQMTQTHSLYLKWIDGAGTDNLVSWATSTGPVSDTHPDINGGAATDVQRINISVPATITLPTLTAPSVSYTVVNNGAGAYTFSGSASGDNPNIGPFYRGGTYTFNITATGHPLYLTTDNGTNFTSGTYFGEYTDGVTGSRTDSGTLTIVVPNDAPDTLYYQCGVHGVMRGAITVKDLAVETNINGNPVVYFQHTQEGHKTPVELRPIPSLVNQMCLVYDAGTGKFVPQDLATYVENTPSFENKIREVAGTAELVVEDGSAVVAKVNVYQDSTYLPLVGNNAGDQAFATDNNKLYIWDGSAWQLAGAANTGELPEGTNLYYTDARVANYLSANDFDTATNIVASITDSAPATLDTLNELAAALGDDPNFATTITNSLALKAPLASPDFTGKVEITGSGTMGGGVNMSNSFITLTDTSSSLYMDTNEIFTDSTNMHIGTTTGGGAIFLQTNGINKILTVKGVSVGVGLDNENPNAALDVIGFGFANRPTHFKHNYVSDGVGLKILGDESAMDIVANDAGDHGGSITIRGANTGWSLINSVTDNEFQLRRFVASGEGFRTHGNGFNVSTLNQVLTITADGNMGLNNTNLTNNLGTISKVDSLSLIGNSTDGAYVGYNIAYDSDWIYQETSAVGILSFTNSGDLTYRSSPSGTAGTVPFLTEQFKINQSNGYVDMCGASQVRLTLGNEGTAGTNTANWIRGNAGYLQYNAASTAHTWEIGGGQYMRLDSDGLGIGENDPSYRLDVAGGKVRFRGATTNSIGNLVVPNNTNVFSYAQENGLQIAAEASGDWASHLILTNVPASGTNTHWVMHHYPVTGAQGYRQDGLTFRYQSSNDASAIGGDGAGTDALTLTTNGTVKVNGSQAGENFGVLGRARFHGSDYQQIKLHSASNQGFAGIQFQDQINTATGSDGRNDADQYGFLRFSHGDGMNQTISGQSANAGYQFGSSEPVNVISFQYGMTTTSYGTNAGEIRFGSGVSTTYSTSSDRRLKTNILPVELGKGKDKILALNPVTYCLIGDTKPEPTIHTGFIAQEMHEVMPEIVQGYNMVDVETGEPTMMSIDYSKLTPVLVAALQDALTEIDELKARLDAAGIS